MVKITDKAELDDDGGDDDDGDDDDIYRSSMV